MVQYNIHYDECQRIFKRFPAEDYPNNKNFDVMAPIIKLQFYKC